MPGEALPALRGLGAQRGLCLICYGKAKKKVEAGEVTWEELVEMGLCEGVADPFDEAFNNAMKGKDAAATDRVD